MSMIQNPRDNPHASSNEYTLCPREAAESITADRPEWDVEVIETRFSIAPTIRFEAGTGQDCVAVHINPKTTFKLRAFGRVVDRYEVLLLTRGKVDMMRSKTESTLEEAFETAVGIIIDRTP